MNARDTVLGKLTQNGGFSFSESELSPELRKRIGELAELQYKADYSQYHAYILHEREQNITGVTIFLLVPLGLVFTIVGLAFFSYESYALEVGVPLLVGVFLAFVYLKTVNQQIQERQHEAARITSEVSSKTATLSKEIFNELSAKDKAKTTPPTLSGTVYKETIVKEVVMIPCTHCKGLMPNTSLYCPNCGAPKRT